MDSHFRWDLIHPAHPVFQPLLIPLAVQDQSIHLQECQQDLLVLLVLLVEAMACLLEVVSSIQVSALVQAVLDLGSCLNKWEAVVACPQWVGAGA